MPDFGAVELTCRGCGIRLRFTPTFHGKFLDTKHTPAAPNPPCGQECKDHIAEVIRKYPETRYEPKAK